MTVIRGIQGLGKTTLVASWLQDQPDSVRSVWVSLAADSGLKQAFDHQNLLRPSRTGLVDPQSYLPDPDSEDRVLDPLAIAEVAFGAARAGQRVVLVIDDADRLRDKAVLGAMVRFFSRYRGMHLILCSRVQHPIEQIAAGVANLILVTARDLLFTPPQIRELASNLKVPLSAEAAAELRSAFGGWPEPIRLVLDGANRQGAELALSRAERYLLDIVFPGLGNEQGLRRLMQFALAERLTDRLVRDLGDTKPEGVVRLLESAALAERHHEGSEIVLEIPWFVRDILRHTFRAREPEHARYMHRRLSQWFLENNGPSHLPLALHHAVAGEDWRQVDRIWTRHSVMLGLEHTKQLSTVLAAVPDRVLGARPGMLVGEAMAGAAASSFDDKWGRAAWCAYLQASSQVAARGLGSVTLHDLLFVGSGRLMSLRESGQFREADRLGRQIGQRVARLTSEGQEAGDQLAWFYLQRGLNDTMLGRHVDAAHFFLLTWEHGRKIPHLAATAAANLALTYALTAASGTAARWLARHRGIDTSQTWVREVVDVGANLAGALLALDGLDFDECRSRLEAVGDGTARVELWPFIAFIHAQYGLHYGDALTALVELDNARDAHRPEVAASDVSVVLLLRARADLLLAAGQVQRARRLLADYNGEPCSTLQVAAARVSLLGDEPAQARRIAAGWLWRHETDNRARLEFLLIEAAAAHRMNDLAGSAILTRQALSLHKRIGLLRAFTTLPRDVLSELFNNAGESLDVSGLATVVGSGTPFDVHVPLIQLTHREQVLAADLFTNASRQDIADRHYLSVNTVRKQLVTLYRKLDVNTREQALTRLSELGLGGQLDATPKTLPNQNERNDRSNHL
jgi:LuxR family maltose regulon positive regulatory protein